MSINIGKTKNDPGVVLSINVWALLGYSNLKKMDGYVK